MSLQGYQYVVLRCVPGSGASSVNVGVVLYSQAADFLEARYAVDEARLHALAPGVEVAEVMAASRPCARCGGETGGSLPTSGATGRRFGWLSAPRSTVVQPGHVHGGLTADPHAELAELVERMVG